MESARLSSKGQITLPKLIRDLLGLKTGDSIGFRLSGNKLDIVRLGQAEDFYGSVRADGPQDFKKIRQAIKIDLAGKAAHEGK